MSQRTNDATVSSKKVKRRRNLREAMRSSVSVCVEMFGASDDRTVPYLVDARRRDVHHLMLTKAPQAAARPDPTST